jgi:hypothetical protein
LVRVLDNEFVVTDPGDIIFTPPDRVDEQPVQYS